MTKTTRRNLFRGVAVRRADEAAPAAEIVSLIVNAFPQHLEGVAQLISAMPGADVHVTDHSGKLIVVLEAPTQGEIGSMANAISGLPHVLSAAMVFQATDNTAA